MRIHRYIPLLSSLVAVAYLSACTEGRSADNPTSSYEVSVKNATAANAISPYLVIVHKAGSSLFETGGQATEGLQELAETGATDKIQAELAANTNVLSVSKVTGSPLTAAETRSLQFSIANDEATAGARVTVIAMIGMSNDSFIALRNMDLSKVDGSAYPAANFDAGTEESTGAVADFGPGGHPVANAEGHISYDRGLNPAGGAPQSIGWGPVAAEVSIKKL